MALNFKKIWEGLKIVKKTVSTSDSSGDLEVLSDNKLYYYNAAEDTKNSPVVTEAHSAILTNKTFDANATGNTLSNVETADLASGVLVPSTSIIGSPGITAASTDTQIPSAKAVYEALDKQNEASEIIFVPTAEIPDTDVQAAIEQVQENLQTHIDESLAAHAASAISSSPLGNLEADNVQDALDELQSDVDTRVAASGGTLTNGLIITPARSDVKQGLKSALDIYAATATNGQIVFATDPDEKKMYQIIDGALVAIGGAGTAKLTAGEAISALDLVYISSGTGNDSARTAGRIYKADASNNDRVDVIGFATKAILSGAVGEVQVSGNLTGFSGLTSGQLYYASASTPGAITLTAPSTSGEWVVAAGLAFSATELVINPVASASAIYNAAPDTSFTIANNISSATNITSLLFSGITYRSFILDYSIYRSTATASSAVAQVGQLRGVYNTQSSTWYLSDDYSGQNAGVTFSITSSGQIQYTSSSIAGSSYSGTMKYTTRKTFGI